MPSRSIKEAAIKKQSKKKEREDQRKVQAALSGSLADRKPWLPRWGTPSVEFTTERQEAFLLHYRATGLRAISAELAGVSPESVKAMERRSKEFADAVVAAKDLWVENVLAKAAIRRAVEGVQRPVIGGKFRDEVVTYETVYSDGLLTKMLDAHQPHIYKPGSVPPEGQASGAGVLVIPAAPASLTEWELGFSELAKGDHGAEAIE